MCERSIQAAQIHCNTMPLRFPEMLTVCGIEEDSQGPKMVIFSLVRNMGGQESMLGDFIFRHMLHCIRMRDIGETMETQIHSRIQRLMGTEFALLIEVTATTCEDLRH